VFGITFVGLHPVTRLPREFRWCHDDAVVAKLKQAAHKDKAAGASLVAEVQTNILPVIFAQAGDELFNSMEAVAHLAQAADFTAPA
jgi:hypothetical protein